MTDREMEDNSGISYATWQDRQLAVILARTADLLRELRAGATSAGRTEDLSRELGKAAALLELREAELRQAVDDAQFWQARSAALDRQLERQSADEQELRARNRELQEIEKELRAGQQRLQKEVARLAAIESNYATEAQMLNARASASANEAANLRRLANDLQSSLSWKITAPLRFLTKPFFKARAPKDSAAATILAPEIPRQGIAATGPVAEAEPAFSTRLAGFVDSLLPELRRAQSIAIIPCAIPFSSTLNQRPISCARYLADQGATVVYVAWQWFPDELVPQAGEEVYPRVFHLPIYAFLNHADSLAAASHAKSTYFCTLPSPSLVEVVRPLRAAGYHIHYDLMDDWEGFHRGGEAPWFSAPVEQEIVITADTVTAVSEKLVQKFDHLRSDIVLVRNGYQPAAMGCEQFAAARMPLESPKVVGYFGHFSDAWFDWDAVIHAAKTMPDVQFELIGWAISEATRQRLAGLSNIRMPGIVPQKELHRYARKWWLGIIPFQATQVSAAVDPLKIYEYLHLGLPSVVTGISGIAEFPLVRYAQGKDQFVEAIRQVTARPKEEYLGEVAEFLKDCVWDERFAKMVHVMGEAVGLASLYAR